MENGSAVMLTWSKAGVISEALGSIGIICTLLYSVWSFTTTLRDAYYAELDRVYFELLKIGLEKPELLSYPTSPTSPSICVFSAPAKSPAWKTAGIFALPITPDSQRRSTPGSPGSPHRKTLFSSARSWPACPRRRRHFNAPNH